MSNNILLENGQPIPLQDGSVLLAETKTLIVTNVDGNTIGYAINDPQTGFFYNWATGKMAYGFVPTDNVTPMKSVLPTGLFSTMKTVVVPQPLTGKGFLGNVVEMDASFTVALRVVQSEPL